MSDWPFADPPNFASYSTRGVMERGEPILLVAHEADDGAWQFIGYEADPGELVLVCLEHAVGLDASVRDLADLPRGWAAERDGLGAPWRRYELPPEE
jgi:hypothetical protein